MLKIEKTGTVIAIYISPPKNPNPMPMGGHKEFNPCISLTQAEVIKGMGIKEDRWFGTNSLKRHDGVSIPNNHARHISFFEEEMIKEVQELGFQFKAIDLRRNILVKNFPLNNLIDVEFSIGTVHFIGSRLCHGCDRIENMLGLKGINKALYMRGGLRAAVLNDGIIKVGDKIKCC